MPRMCCVREDAVTGQPPQMPTACKLFKVDRIKKPAAGETCNFHNIQVQTTHVRSDMFRMHVQHVQGIRTRSATR